MRVVLASRFPLIDVLDWKRRIAEALRQRGVELLVLHSRSGVREQLLAGADAVGQRLESRGGASAGSTQSSSRGRRQLPVSLHRWAKANDVRTLTTGRLADEDCLCEVAEFGADAMLLLGADIVPRALLERIDGPTLNPHFGLLPEYRGMNVAEWAVYNDDPVGLTVHVVDAGIDTGAIVERIRVPVIAGDDLAAIRSRQREIGVEALLRAVDALQGGGLEPTTQAPGDGRQYYRMHPRMRAEAEERLRTGAYSWLQTSSPTEESGLASRSSGDMSSEALHRHGS